MFQRLYRKSRVAPSAATQGRSMSIFEIIMLVCFGAAWPFSIYKSWKSREVGSKSLLFLFALLLGYVAGILHKVLFSFDGVIYLYGLNALMVTADLMLSIRNRLLQIRQSAAAARSPASVTAKSATHLPNGSIQ